MTMPRPLYAITLAVAVIALIAVASYSAFAASQRNDRTQARAEALSAMETLALPAGITKAPAGTSCGVPAEEGVCLVSTLTPDKTAAALAPVLGSTAGPVKDPNDIAKVPSAYTVVGVVAGEPVMAYASANLIGVDKAKHKLRFEGTTVSLSLLDTD